MEQLSVSLFATGTIIGGALAVIFALSSYRTYLRKRTRELRATAAALTAHYDAVNVIVDDPALPLEALETLAIFTENITSKEFCEGLAGRLVFSENRKYESPPAWFEKMESLKSSRPDVVQNFHKAISTGLVSLFLRWPTTAQMFEQLMADLAADGRREYVIADRLTKARQKQKSKTNGDNHLPGGLVTA
jgi:hypothetical protein